MLEFLRNLFSSEGFMPHGHCVLWKTHLVGLHVISDSLIALSYYSIPILLILFVRKRRDIPYPWMFLMFGAFILACGTTHIMGIWTIWKPLHWLDGWVKAATAAISLATAILLVPLVPKALALRSPAELEAANRELEKEIMIRKQVEKELARLASFPELNPSPVIEMNALGNVTYLNPVAQDMFPDIQETRLKHPILEGLGSVISTLNGGQRSLTREIAIGSVVFEQKIWSASENDLIRIYSTDITERKHAEDELRKAHDELEMRVQERTNELLKTNEKLRDEIIERNRVEETLRETTERLQALSQRLAEVQEKERRRLVEVLHDQIGQDLTAISFNIKILGNSLSPASLSKVSTQLKDTLQLLEGTTVRIRDVMTELYPPVLNDYGLFATLCWFGRETSARTGLEVIVEGEELTPRLPLDKETALFRITQEAVNNIIKHAFASHVKIKLQSDSSFGLLNISDNGVGFDPISISTNGARQSWGMLLMHGRADAIGGSLRVNSAPGQGTEVIVYVGR